MIFLSVNINKIALIRNSRGADYPNIIKMAKKLLDCGANGITIHPRPDQRHIRYEDAFQLKKLLPKDVELNIEGYPSKKFLEMVCQVQPAQCTLVPDEPDALTSNQGWDCKKYLNLLIQIIQRLKQNDIRASLFIEPDSQQIQHALQIGTQRIELFTEYYAKSYHTPQKESVFQSYCQTANQANKYGLEINAGHDLNLENLAYFAQLPHLKEVSIGHALVIDMLHLGMKNTINEYKKRLTI